jgi:acyl-CoA synthetase (AMP-forming)/AMP-acid ligase II
VIRRPWVERYDPGVPASLAPHPERTLVDVVEEAAREPPGHPGAYFKGAALTYAVLARASDAFAAALAAERRARA